MASDPVEKGMTHVLYIFPRTLGRHLRPSRFRSVSTPPICSPFVLTSYQFWEIKQNHYDTVRSHTPINRSFVTDSVHVDLLLPERVSHTCNASRLSYRSHPFQKVLQGQAILLSQSPHTILICPLALWTPNFRPQTDFACQNVHGWRT